MIVTIVRGKITSDQQVIKDGRVATGVDFSDVNSDLWALTWDSETKKGEIEWATYETPNQSVTSETEIDSAIGVPVQTLLDRAQVVFDEQDAAEDSKIRAEADAVAQVDIDFMYSSLPEWEQRRMKEHPTEQELLIALYDTEDKAAIDAKRAAVKAKWPKDNSGPIE